MRRFYAPPDQIGPDIITLNADESRHATKVLRLSTGDEVFVFDGLGREYRGTVATAARHGVEIAVAEDVRPAAPESPFSITLCSAVLPGDKYDIIVQKSVELGVVELVPLITTRCEVRARDAEKRLERWRRIAMEATKQCGRATLMNVAVPAEFLGVLAERPRHQTIMFSERDGGPFPQQVDERELTAFIGPKGGWADGELAAALNEEVEIVTLGGRILRAETAAIALTALLQHRFGDFR